MIFILFPCRQCSYILSEFSHLPIARYGKILIELNEECGVTKNLVWMDLEMTGLDPATDLIIEIATIITDQDLNIVEEGPVIAINQPEENLLSMDEWNQKHHRESGLVKRVQESRFSQIEAEAQTLDFIERHVEKNSSPLCGNTIWQDRRFLSIHMPNLEAYFHYRIIDVSSLKELAHLWKPEVLSSLSKENKHTALSDVRESISELKHYRQHFFDLK
ncbi:MAG: oligoribonuclease [Gammaproteobacteria bacterium]|nr:oligoribonuclease [Gammaproteobacteria bacterium]